jgi:hypothetical protein
MVLDLCYQSRKCMCVRCATESSSSSSHRSNSAPLGDYCIGHNATLYLIHRLLGHGAAEDAKRKPIVNYRLRLSPMPNQRRVAINSSIIITWYGRESVMNSSLPLTHLDESLTQQATIRVQRVASPSWTRSSSRRDTLTDDIKPFVDVMDRCVSDNVLPLPIPVADIIISYCIEKFTHTPTTTPDGAQVQYTRVHSPLTNDSKIIIIINRSKVKRNIMVHGHGHLHPHNHWIMMHIISCPSPGPPKYYLCCVGYP